MADCVQGRPLSGFDELAISHAHGATEGWSNCQSVQVGCRVCVCVCVPLRRRQSYLMFEISTRSKIGRDGPRPICELSHPAPALDTHLLASHLPPWIGRRLLYIGARVKKLQLPELRRLG